MTAPVIVVTGPIASGKTTIASVMAGRGGLLIEADGLARKAYEDPGLKRRIRSAFGAGVFARSGSVSRTKLAAAVFSSRERLFTLNRLVRPVVKRIIEEKVREGRKNSRYIVLDAVLYFHYKFRFRAEIVVAAEAPVDIRAKRLMRRNGLGRAEAMRRIGSQEYLKDGWSRAGLTIRTDRSIGAVRREAAKVRDRFLKEHGIAESEKR